MLNPLLLPELREMLAADDRQGMNDVINELHAATVAEFTEGLTVEETWRFLGHASIERQAEVFDFYPHDKQVELVSGVGRERMSRLIEAMAHDERVDLLKRLDEDVVESLLPLVAHADREDIRKLLSYPESSAGAVMTTDYASLHENVTVSEALSQLRLQAAKSETIYYIYVLDGERRLIGFVSLHDLILARPSLHVADIMQRDTISVRVDQDREEVAKVMARYDFLAMPVVDAQGHLVGIITHDDVIDVMVEEATEDVHRFGGVAPLVESYMEARFVTVWRKRAGWLSLLFVAGLATIFALASFQKSLESVLVLTLFIPLCIGTGGNSGSQAATLITRELALGQLTQRDWMRVFWHELAMGLALGVSLGAVGMVLCLLLPRSLLGDSVPGWQLGLIVSQAVMAICLWGTLVGSMLPLIFRALGFDPAFASSPFVAMFVDVTGIVIYFVIANLYLM